MAKLKNKTLRRIGNGILDALKVIASPVFILGMQARENIKSQDGGSGNIDKLRAFVTLSMLALIVLYLTGAIEEETFEYLLNLINESSDS